MGNHAKWDPIFHFVLAPVLLVNLGLAVRHMWAYPAYTTVLAVVMAVALFLMLLKIRMNALKVQDRLIRLEERLRMKEILTPELYQQSLLLSEKQVVALRFASDGELATLVKRAVDEKLDSKQIKQQIQHWRPDYFRV